MSTAKHTPGPWGMDEDGKVFSGTKQYNRVPLISPWVEDAFDKENAEAFANMRLIAAAPELLEALRCAVVALAGINSMFNDCAKEEYRIVSAAIAKATGGAA